MKLRQLPFVAVAGSALFLGPDRALGQPRDDVRAGRDVYAGVVAGREAPAQAGLLAELGLPTGEGLRAKGRFEVPIWALLFTDGKFSGTTRYQASDGSRMLIVMRAKARVLGMEHERDVVLTMRPTDDPAKLRFAGRMVKEVSADTLRAVKDAKTVDEKIDALLEGIGEAERVGDKPMSPESLLAVDSAGGGEVKLTRLKDDGSRGEPVSLVRAGDELSMSFKGYDLDLTIPAPDGAR